MFCLLHARHSISQHLHSVLGSRCELRVSESSRGTSTHHFNYSITLHFLITITQINKNTDRWCDHSDPADVTHPPETLLQTNHIPSGYQFSSALSPSNSCKWIKKTLVFTCYSLLMLCSLFSKWSCRMILDQVTSFYGSQSLVCALQWHLCIVL